MFSGIEEMFAQDGRPLVVDAGPGTDLTIIYRARVFQSDEKLIAALCRPDMQLGSPPADLANHGRMNARGISVFYGANDPKVAIAEVRPPVGSQVAVARFEIVRPLRLLDLTALSIVDESGSVFDLGLAGRMERAMFLRSLSQRITRPVMPDDEVFEYLPTQAVADFLATEKDPPLDGILYPSVQAAGDVLNVVLFQKAARVSTIEVPSGTEIEASTGEMYDEGWEPRYTVVERVPPQQAKKEDEKDDLWPDLASFTEAPWTSSDMDLRESALRIDLESIKVHIVQRVMFETDEFDVTRHRWEKRENADF